LRGRLVAAGGVDPAAATVRLDLDGDPIVSLPAGSLVASRGGARWRLRPVTPPFRRLDLRRVRGANLAVRLVVAASPPPEPGRSATIAVVLGERAFCGSARVRGR